MVPFIQIQVEEHDELPDGCCLRYKAEGPGREIARVRWESEDGTDGIWTLEAAWSDGRRTAAQAYPVEDSSAGTSILVVGGDHGLRLTSIDTGQRVAEPYLLLGELKPEA